MPDPTNVPQEVSLGGLLAKLSSIEPCTIALMLVVGGAGWLVNDLSGRMIAAIDRNTAAISALQQLLHH